MKFHVVIPCWRRPNITKKCFHALASLIEESKHDYDVTCIISEEEYIPICQSFGFNFFPYKNNPLGEKINAGIKKALESEFDYLMIMNSDSMVNVKLIDEIYEPALKENKPFIGVNKIYYVDSVSGNARVYTYDDFTILGVAKLIRKDVVQKAFQGGELYRSELNKGLDHTMMDSLLVRQRVYPTIVPYDEPLAVDIKSDINIWPFDFFKDKGEEADINYLSTFFKELRCFCKQAA